MVIIEFKCGVYAGGRGVHSGVDKRLIRNVGWVERSLAAISPIKQEVRQRKKKQLPPEHCARHYRVENDMKSSAYQAESLMKQSRRTNERERNRDSHSRRSSALFKKVKLTRVLEIEIQRLEIDSVATFSPFVDRVSRFRRDGRISTSD